MIEVSVMQRLKRTLTNACINGVCQCDNTLLIFNFRISPQKSKMARNDLKMISLFACLILASLAAGAPSGQAGFLMFFPSATMPC